MFLMRVYNLKKNNVNKSTMNIFFNIFHYEPHIIYG